MFEKNVGSKRFGSQRLRPPKFGFEKFGKIGSVTAEILLICTNVANNVLPGQMSQ